MRTGEVMTDIPIKTIRNDETGEFGVGPLSVYIRFHYIHGYANESDLGFYTFVKFLPKISDENTKNTRKFEATCSSLDAGKGKFFLTTILASQK